MKQWISIEEAACKYQIDEEYLWLWTEIRVIDVDYTREGTFIDDESLRQFIVKGEERMTSAYVERIEKLCIEKSKACRLYISLLGMQDRQIASAGNVHGSSGARSWWRSLCEWLQL